MAHSMDNNGRDSSSTRSGAAGGGSTEFLQSSAMARPPAQTTLTASSSSNYASSVSSDSQIQTGGLPGTPVTRRSGGWDRQTLSPAAAAREDHVVKTNSIEDSSDSSDEFVASYKPMERPKRVLDVGTGPGTWALEFATKYPSCSVLGVDIEPVHPPYTKSNCSFKTFDITHDWDIFNGGDFDFIHVRQLGDIGDKKKLIQSAFDNLRPGGWVEFTEWIAILQSPNHSLNGTQFRRWNDLMEQGMRNFGTTLKYPEKFKPYLQEAGFERVIETRHGAPTNACYPGKKLQRIGHLMTQNWLVAGAGEEVSGGCEEGDWEHKIPFIYDINNLLCPKAGTWIINAIEFRAGFGLGVSVDVCVGIFYATMRKDIVLGYGISSL
ncbi:uncharacterized protein FSUBG_9655 [Fusarium subglutinans]|uniref:Methyltransferase n=1 Tax=Gibberella subglutinans TaxID=42677 RepID=A0A8H5UNR9_GIBSU|nr:uncharacterized protein FSUBG_9655 [Fusarium subglutinans]KAF5593882.1 hypothetical protein FSUBG_9655 [Fusarium subglutinans]